MKRQLHIILLGLLLAVPAWSQVVIRGKVFNTQMKPLENANIGILNSYAGATTDADGNFSFTTDGRGSVKVVAQMLGFAHQPMTIMISDTTKQVTLKFILSEESINLDGVTVKSKKTDFLGRGGLPSLRALEVRAMGGSNADIANGIRTMPGVQATSDATGLFVRGGTSDETKVYVDGLLANNFFYNGSPDVSQRGRFAPELFSGNFFSSGGYSALYGQALSSALILETNDVATKSSIGGNVSTTGAMIEMNRVIRPEKLSAGGSITYTNMSPYYGVVPQRRTFTAGPEYLDGLFHLKYRAGDKGALKVLGTIGRNNVEFLQPTSGRTAQYGLLSSNGFISVSYAGSAGKNWTMNAGFGASISDNTASIDSLPRLEGETSLLRSRQIKQQVYNTRLVFRRSIGRGSDLYLGMDHVLTNTGQQLTQQNRYAPTRYLTEQYGALFAESNLSISRTVSARVGLRAEGVSSINRMALAPRVALSYAPAKAHKLTLSYGQFFQQPTFDYLITNRNRDNLRFQKATHYIASYQMVRTNQLLRVELYQKTYSHLLRTTPDTSSTGTGYARGFEVLWKEDNRLPNVNYWVSYSFLDTKRQYLNYPVLAQPNFAATHTAATVVNVLIPSIPLNIGMTYTFASGRPYYNPNRLADQFMTDKTSAYHNVGATIAYLTHLGKANTTLAFSANNLLGSQQVFGYQYTSLNSREAVMPLAKRFYYLGLFINWGIDKRSKTLNDLLPN
ncbi:TonB-dependent receptor [Spirosoma terrae]|uniref:TonB-dependent receptor n=1 Tax=Spirosoma terrae TaxID=1968276 RepID=A0A6L9LBP1_9BACT|nr:TonB-dependent receptor [Spirosoma terrae]NDU97870.1 TonB-dependent receptor [Spirosoma terrae]